MGKIQRVGLAFEIIGSALWIRGIIGMSDARIAFGIAIVGFVWLILGAAILILSDD